MQDIPKKAYAVVIDTEDYAGNFERQMCAFCTGQIGECGVGEEEAAIFEDAKTGVDFENVISVTNSDHCSRPCTIYPTPGWYNHGLEGYFKKGEEKKALAHHIAQIQKNLKEYIKAPIHNLRELKKPGNNKEKERLAKLGWTLESTQRQIENQRKATEKAIAKAKLKKYPAYLSIAIFFETKPTPQQMELIKNRAKEYVKYRVKHGESWQKKPIKITGFRLLHNKTTVVEIKQP